MQYAIYPMRTISISQRFHDKHKAWDLNGEDTGIDYWYAPCRVKVLAIYPIDTTGFYNTVLFGSCDENGNPAEVMCEDGVARVLTFGCTHMNSVQKFGLTVNKIYQSGERCYCEGNTGLGSTGNHVHMDVAEGWQYKKQKYDGQWLLPNLVNIANVFHQLKGWNVVRNLNGYTFKEVESREVPEVEEPKVEPTPEAKPNKLVDGYQELSWLDQKVHVYKVPEDAFLTQYAMPYGTVADMRDIAIDGYDILCITNSNYFNMKSGNNDILGSHKGINCDQMTIGKGEDNFVGYKGSNDKPYTDLAIYKDGRLVYGDFNSWEHRGDNVQMVVAPAGVQMDGGNNKSWYSPAVGWSKMTAANTQTLLWGQNGHYALVCVDGELTSSQCREMARHYGMDHQSSYDAGGSTEMIADGEVKMHSDRKQPIFFVVLRKKVELKTEEPAPVEPEVVPEPVEPETPSQSDSEPVTEPLVPADPITPAEPEQPVEEPTEDDRAISVWQLLFKLLAAVLKLVFGKK